MSQLFHLKVNTPNGVLFEDDIYQCSINTITGWRGFLANASPLIGAFNTSHFLVLDQRKNKVDIIIGRGIFQYNENTLNLFTNYFAFATNLNQDAMKAQEEQIKETLASQMQNQENDEHFEVLQLKLKEHINEFYKLLHNEYNPEDNH